MPRVPPPKRPSASQTWSSAAEHLVKMAVYALFAVHAVRSACRSGAAASRAINALVGLVAAWMAAGEVGLAIKRVRRRLPPGYIGLPVLREVRAFRQMSSGDGMARSLNAMREKYGSFFASCFVGNLNVVLGGQSDLSWIFNSDCKGLTEAAWPPNIAMLLGPGSLSNQTGRHHRALRRMMEPYFAPKFVNNYLECVDRVTMKELEDWSATGEFLPSSRLKMYALRLFYISSFGRIDDEVIASLHDDFKTWIGGFFVLVNKRVPGTALDEAMRARERILNTFDGLIDRFQEENPEDSERAQKTVVGRLIYGRDRENNRAMTRDEMRDNLLILLFAGHDTTNSSLATLLYHLGRNPDAAEALAGEASALSDPLRPEELRNAPVLNACIHESWRMDPPVPGGFRKVARETEHGGYTYDEGTVFNYSILMAASDEALYDKHDKFNMRRFLPEGHPLYRPEDDSGVDPLQGRTNYPIFGGGTHVCLGKAFAQLELRVFAARIMRHYKVEVRDPRKVFVPVNGWKAEFRLTRRRD